MFAYYSLRNAEVAGEALASNNFSFRDELAQAERLLRY